MEMISSIVYNICTSIIVRGTQFFGNDLTCGSTVIYLFSNETRRLNINRRALDRGSYTGFGVALGKKLF